MKRFLLFFCLVLLLTATATVSADQIWIESGHYSDIAELVNIKEDLKGLFWRAWTDTVVVSYQNTGNNVAGGNTACPTYSPSSPVFVDYVKVWTELAPFELTVTVYLPVGSTITYKKTIQGGDVSSVYSFFEVGTVATKVTVCGKNLATTTGRLSTWVYTRPWSSDSSYIITREINKESGLKTRINGTCSVEYIAADNSTGAVSDRSEISAMPDSMFPMRFKITCNAGKYLKYFGVVKDAVYGYAYDRNGKPLTGGKVVATDFTEYSQPGVDTSSVVTGYGSITIYVYYNGQPYKGAKIKVRNPAGMDAVIPGATDANGKINITGLDSLDKWDTDMRYTFYAYDLALNPLTDAFGNQLNVSVDFIGGIPQTNPAVIYNTYGYTELYEDLIDEKGEFILSTLDSTKSSKLYTINVYDRDGQLLYTKSGIQPPYYIVFGESRGGGGEEENTQYGNPNSKYVVILDKTTAKINEPIAVKVRNTQRAWWNPFDPEWVEGAEIYVDGIPTGKKTIKIHTGNWLSDLIIGWIAPNEPSTIIQISSAGTHYVYAKVGNEYSQAVTVTITGETYDFRGGAENGTYPGTDPYNDNGNCNYRLIYTPTSVKVGGSVTFKVVKACGGSIVGSEKGMIYVDGIFVGTANPELVYRFNDAGVHKVYAIINTPTGTFKTSEGVITVYENTNDFINDNGQSSGIHVTVQVFSADTKQPIAGILVQRLAGSQAVEQRMTDKDGKAVLHPEAGKTYSVLVSDPSNRYISQLRNGLSWSANDTLTFYLKPAGDINGDNSTDLDMKELTQIEVRIDGFPEDGISLPPGKHRISVIDQSRKEIAGATIYINGNKVGQTGGLGCFVWGCPFGAGLDYDFSIPGNYEVKAEYQSLTDTIYVNITNNVNSYMLIAYPQEGVWPFVGFSSSAMVNSVKVLKGYKVHFEVAEVNPSKPITDWRRVENAVIFINGNQMGVTKPIGGIFGWGAVPAYEHTFSEPGNYTAYATYGDAETQTMTVYVLEGEQGSGTTFGGAIADFFGQLAKAMPITRIPMLDTVLWAVICIVVGAAVLGIAVRMII